MHDATVRWNSIYTIRGLLVLFIIFGVIASLFFVTRGSSPAQAELAFIEHTLHGGKSAGSVIPASCNSNPHSVTDCPVPPPAPTASLGVSPTTVEYGARATLTYTSQNASGCTLYENGVASPRGGGAASYSGFATHYSTVTFGLTCSGPGGSVSPPNVTLTVLPLQAPPTPAYVSVQPSQCSDGGSADYITVSWNSSKWATSYTLYANGSPVYTGASVRYVHRGLAKNSVHSYRVIATNAAGSSTPTAAIQGTVPGECNPTPANLVGTPGACGNNMESILLSWDSTPNAIGYKLAARQGGSTNSEVYRGAATTYTFNDSSGWPSMWPNTEYHFSISAYDEYYRESAKSPEVSVISPSNTCPDLDEPPQNVQTVPGSCDTGITVSWDSVPNAARYQVEDQFYGIVYDGPNASFVHNPLVPNSNHRYRVQAFNNTYSSPRSNYTPQVQAPNACSTRPDSSPWIDAVAGACSTGKINISWGAATDASGYRLMHAENADPLTPLYTGTGLSFTHTGLSEGNGHRYQIIATNGRGDSLGMNPEDYDFAPSASCVNSPNLMSGPITLNSGSLFEAEWPASVTFASSISNTTMADANFTDHAWSYRWGATGTWQNLGFPSETTPPISGGASENVVSYWDFTLDQSGPLQIKLCADVLSRVSETNELDNCKVETFTIAPGRPNLRSSTIEVVPGSGVLNTGSSPSFRAYVFNDTGFSTNAPFTNIFMYRWGISGSFTQFGPDIRLPFLSGNSSSVNNSAQINLTNTGPIQIRHCVDSLQEITNETFESDNCVIQTFNIAANTPPVVNAGPDRQISPPTASASPVGADATDPNGIASREWTFISGPSTPGISNSNTMTPIFSNMSIPGGSYVFRLTATSTIGLASSDDMVVSVVVAACSDGIDNDSDNRIDYPQDAGCSSSSDNDESGPTPTVNFSVCDPGPINCMAGKTVDPSVPLVLRWSSTNATRCDPVAGAGFVTGGATADTDDVIAPALPGVSETYTIACRYGDGTPERSDVVISTIPGPALLASPNVAKINQPITLSWDTNNGDETLCRLVGSGVNLLEGQLDDNGTGDNETGSVVVTVSGRSVFTLTCPTGISRKTIEVIPIGWES